MAEDILGYVRHEILRKDAGSPPTTFVFNKRTESVMIDNLGDEPVYFRFDGTASTGSIDGFLNARSFRVFDVKIGSVSVLGSGTATPDIMCVGLYNQ